MKEILTHICFDLDDTLYEQLAPFQHALNQLHPVAQEKLRDIYKSFRSRSNEMFFLHQNKEISFECMHIKRIQLALKDHGILINDKEAMDFQTAYQKGQYEIALSSTIIELLDYLKSRAVRISVITNGPKEHHSSWSPKVLYLSIPAFAFIFVSVVILIELATIHPLS